MNYLTSHPAKRAGIPFARLYRNHNDMNMLISSLDLKIITEGSERIAILEKDIRKHDNFTNTSILRELERCFLI